MMESRAAYILEVINSLGDGSYRLLKLSSGSATFGGSGPDIKLRFVGGAGGNDEVSVSRPTVGGGHLGWLYNAYIKHSEYSDHDRIVDIMRRVVVWKPGDYSNCVLTTTL